jgi:hypothetical protein
MVGFGIIQAGAAAGRVRESRFVSNIGACWNGKGAEAGTGAAYGGEPAARPRLTGPGGYNFRTVITRLIPQAIYK